MITPNEGSTDRIARIAIGLILFAVALIFLSDI